MLGIIMLYGVIFGRWICGWLCPFGLLQDLLHKIKTPKIKKNIVTKILSAFKYVILAVFVVVIPLIYMTKDFPLPAFCKYICPAGTVGGALGSLINPGNDGMFGMLGPLFTWKFALAMSILVGTVFVYRLFCRFLCPLGAMYGLFNKFSLFGIKLEKDKCVNCGKCISVCKMDIHHVGDVECINCGECISVCPTKAISYKGAKIILPESEIEAAKTPEERQR
jgi:polyferredoxin